MTADAPDDDLLARLGRDAAAFNVLYERHAQALLAFAFSRFPQIAEDLCQNAWRKALQQVWKPGDQLRPWLFRVVKNAGISAMRRPKTSTLPEVDPAARPVTDDTDDRATLRRCLEKLAAAKPEFHAVMAAFLAGEKPADAAERLGISRANYDQRKGRALDVLAGCARGEGES